MSLDVSASGVISIHELWQKPQLASNINVPSLGSNINWVSRGGQEELEDFMLVYRVRDKIQSNEKGLGQKLCSTSTHLYHHSSTGLTW